jgi:hypothetical protein
MPSTIRGSDNFDTAGGNAVKAWVNFNGTGTVAIRASFNVTSITDNGTGDYTVNFTTAMSDANYAAVGNVGQTASAGFLRLGSSVGVYSASQVQVNALNSSLGFADMAVVNVSIFR